MTGERGQGAGLRAQAVHDRGAVRNRRPAARRPQQVVGEAWVRRRQHRKRRGDRALAHREIRVIGPVGLLPGGQTHARAQPHRRQGKQHGELAIAERRDLVVTAHHLTHDRHGIGRAERRVGHGDGEVVHRVAVDHVTEVDEPSDPLVVRIDEHVVVVRVVVDHRPRQLGETAAIIGLLPVDGNEPIDQIAEGVIGHERPVVSDHVGCPRQIPVERAVQRRMVETDERDVDAGDRPAEVGEQLIGASPNCSERAAAQHRHEPHVMTVDQGRRLACQRRHDMRHEAERSE